MITETKQVLSAKLLASHIKEAKKELEDKLSLLIEEFDEAYGALVFIDKIEVDEVMPQAYIQLRLVDSISIINKPSE